MKRGRFAMSSVVGQLVMVTVMVMVGAVVLALGLANLWYGIRFVMSSP